MATNPPAGPATGGATGSATLGVTPSPTAPPAANPPTPTAPAPAPAAASGDGKGFLYVKNTMARPVHVAGVMLVPGAVTAVPNDKDGVNKRDVDMDGLEIVSAPKATKESARADANRLEVDDVLHPDNSRTTAATADAGGGTLYKPPEEIVKDAKASGWVAPR